MSKAFTSEEAPEVASAVRAPPRIAPGEVRYVTPEGHAALRGELARLRAAGEGSESSEGLESERTARLAERAGRIALLEGTLAALTVLEPAAAPDGRSGFGTWVTAVDEDGTRSTWRLVGPDEADPRRGAVSVHSPLGRALLGRVAGDEVQIERPGGSRTVVVAAVHRTAPGQG